jgi:hypothetical protein
MSVLFIPPPPAELWMLWAEGEGENRWVIAMDDPAKGENYLVCFSEADAQAAADHQNAMYSLNCFPVRVK